MLESRLKISSKNFAYIDHCIGQNGGIIIQSELKKGEKKEPLSHSPITGERCDDYCWGNSYWSRVVDSWDEVVLNISVKPKISESGNSIWGIQYNTELTYAPSRNILNMNPYYSGLIARSLTENAIYVPNANSLRSGIADCFRWDISPSGKELDIMVNLVLEKIPTDTFSFRDLQLSD